MHSHPPVSPSLSPEHRDSFHLHVGGVAVAAVGVGVPAPGAGVAVVVGVVEQLLDGHASPASGVELRDDQGLVQLVVAGAVL